MTTKKTIKKKAPAKAQAKQPLVTPLKRYGMSTQEQEYRKKRIADIATRLIAGQIEKGEIEATDEAIKAAMPEAVKTAQQAFDAAMDYVFK